MYLCRPRPSSKHSPICPPFDTPHLPLSSWRTSNHSLPSLTVSLLTANHGSHQALPRLYTLVLVLLLAQAPLRAALCRSLSDPPLLSGPKPSHAPHSCPRSCPCPCADHSARDMRWQGNGDLSRFVRSNVPVSMAFFLILVRERLMHQERS